MRKTFVLATAVCAVTLALPAAAGANGTPIPGQYIVVLKGGSDVSQTVNAHRKSANADVIARYGHALKGYTAKLSSAGLAKVKADPRVDYVFQDREGVAVQTQMLPTGVTRIADDVATPIAGNGVGTTAGDVAVFDTGIQPNHPDLNVAGGVDCLNGYSGDDGTYNDANGHGTHVAGIIGAKDDANGVVGTAPGVRLWAVRTLNLLGSGSASTQLCGIDWVTANGPALGIKVANSSQALFAYADDGNCGFTNNDPLHQAICASTQAGILWVFGTGNNARDFAPNAGTDFDEVLSVSAIADSNGLANPTSTSTFTCKAVDAGKKGGNYAMETDDKYTSYSAWAVSAADQAHTVAAPGQCIYSTYKGSTYGYLSGTSMSGPYAAGVAHLCVVSGQCAGTPADTIQKLRSDAAAYTQANPSWGFKGDPLRPVTGRYYGYLIRAALY